MPVTLLVVGTLLVVAAGLTYWISAATLRPEPPGEDSVLGTIRFCTPYPGTYSCDAEKMSAGTITVVIALGVLGVISLGLALRAWLTKRTS